ncbi:MAG: response regulator [Phycisphaerae bacterium]|nr:response regulator [Phycisphaerae bacterium]
MNEKILIADDEPYILHVLAIKLRNAGYRIVTAMDGEEALATGLAEEPDLIITDYQMPRLSGLELCREYNRQAGRTIPAMLITAREFDIDLNIIATGGIAVVMAKPFSPRQVVQTVERLLNENATTTARI